MRVANPWQKFFTSDLIPDDLEVGNAFWGYHVANNFMRLLGVEGTVYFGTAQFPYENHIYDVPVANLQFHAAPIVQFAALRPRVFEFATTYATVALTQLSLAHDLQPNDSGVVFSSPVFDPRFSAPILPGPFFQNDFDAKIGDNDAEILHLQPLGWTLNNQDTPFSLYQYTFDIVQRNRFSTPSGIHLSGEILGLVTSATQATAAATTLLWEINPPYVEGYLDQEKLRIKWMMADAGTLVYKIFGV